MSKDNRQKVIKMDREHVCGFAHSHHRSPLTNTSKLYQRDAPEVYNRSAIYCSYLAGPFKNRREDGWKAERGERNEPAVQILLYHFISHKSSRHDKKAGAAYKAKRGGVDSIFLESKELNNIALLRQS